MSPEKRIKKKVSFGPCTIIMPHHVPCSEDSFVMEDSMNFDDLEGSISFLSSSSIPLPPANQPKTQKLAKCLKSFRNMNNTSFVENSMSSFTFNNDASLSSSFGGKAFNFSNSNFSNSNFSNSNFSNSNMASFSNSTVINANLSFLDASALDMMNSGMMSMKLSNLDDYRIDEDDRGENSASEHSEDSETKIQVSEPDDFCSPLLQKLKDCDKLDRVKKSSGPSTKKTPIVSGPRRSSYQRTPGRRTPGANRGNFRSNNNLSSISELGTSIDKIDLPSVMGMSMNIGDVFSEHSSEHDDDDDDDVNAIFDEPLIERF